MKIAFIGDIVGKPGRDMIETHLRRIRETEGIEFVIANYENASHGFGLTAKNASELFSFGVDVMTGGNHSWDKKDILPLFETHEILRPHNFPEELGGTGCRVYSVGKEKLAIINLLGHFAMPYSDNAFRCAKETVESLRTIDGVKNILVDFHAEATSEKRAMMMLLQGKVSAIMGTHTHVGTDDLQIAKGTAYLSDVGMSGCRDNVIGMDEKAPLKQFLTGLKGHYEIPKKCKKILQMALLEIENGLCLSAVKLKIYDNGSVVRTEAFLED